MWLRVCGGVGEHERDGWLMADLNRLERDGRSHNERGRTKIVNREQFQTFSLLKEGKNAITGFQSFPYPKLGGTLIIDKPHGR